jgi:putrescine aminotransferase
VPDILCLAKALSGGVIPCGSFTTRDEIFAAFHANPMCHSSTFGNNPLAATAAAKAIEITVRGKGFLLGIEMHDEAQGATLAEQLYSRRILVANALNKPEVVRIEPPLNIPEPYLVRLVEALEASLAE